MTALTTRLTSLSSKDIRLVVSIDGVPLDLTATFAGTAPAAPRLDGRGLLVSVEESRTILDRQLRAQVGGGATIVVQDRNNLLRSLFAVRSFRSAFITTSTTKVVTTLQVSDTTPLPSAGVVYIGSETVQYTGKTATTLTGCTRGAFGSKAQAHRGGAETGNGIYTVPPSWFGRRVRLFATFLDDDGKPDTSFGSEALATFRLEAGPIDKSKGRWELRCSHLSDEVAKRKLGTGIANIENTTPFRIQPSTTAGGDPALAVTLPKGALLAATSPGGRPSQLIIRTKAGGGSITVEGVTYDGEGAFVHDILELTSLVGGQVVALVSPVSRSMERYGLGYLVGTLNSRPTTEQVKQICVLDRRSAGALLLMALLSKTGDGTNGIDDLLPGTEPVTFGGPSVRFGAGFDPSEISAGSVLDAGYRAPGWSWVIDEEIPVSDLLRDFCRATNTAAVYLATGQLSFTPLLDERVTAVATIAESDVLGAITTTVDEGAVYSRVRVECNYDPIDGESEASIDVIDEEIAATYGSAENTLVIESRDLVVTPVADPGEGTLKRTSTQPDELLPFLRRSMLDARGGSLLLTFTASAKHLGLQLGDFVALSMPSVSDYRGGSLAAAQGRVVERQPDWQTMTVALTVLVAERPFHFAPFAIVVSTSGSVVISTTTFGTSSPASPATSFRVGDVLTVYDPVANVVVGDGVQVTGIPSTTSLSLSNAGASPSLPVSPGWVLMLKSSTGATSTDGFIPSDYTYNNGGTVPSRWR